MPRPLSTHGKDPVPIVQEAGWAPGLVWTGAENLPPPGFDPWNVQPIASPVKLWAKREILVMAYNYDFIFSDPAPHMLTLMTAHSQPIMR
jgi:hypothetical protein